MKNFCALRCWLLLLSLSPFVYCCVPYLHCLSLSTAAAVRIQNPKYVPLFKLINNLVSR
ncbi:hypothetical protein Hanom_Chr13g01216301 [Helianthus anomalus]